MIITLTPKLLRITLKNKEQIRSKQNWERQEEKKRKGKQKKKTSKKKNGDEIGVYLRKLLSKKKYLCIYDSEILQTLTKWYMVLMYMNIHDLPNCSFIYAYPLFRRKRKPRTREIVYGRGEKKITINNTQIVQKIN